MLNTIATAFVFSMIVVFGLVVISYPLYGSYFLINKVVSGTIKKVKGV